MDRFKGLDLVDRVPEKPRAEVHNIVQEAVNKSIPKEKESKKAKWLSEEALQIPKERREVKYKEERERYIKLKAYFQRTARRAKEVFYEQYIKLEQAAEGKILKISSGKLEMSRGHFAQRWAQ